MGYKSSVRSRWLDIGQVLFLRVDGQRQSRSINSPKKEQCRYPAILTEQAQSMRDLLYVLQRSFSCRTQQVVLSRQDSSIYPTWVANHRAGFDPSCPFTEGRFLYLLIKICFKNCSHMPTLNSVFNKCPHSGLTVTWDVCTVKTITTATRLSVKPKWYHD